ncbi:hypothetical protein [Kitasatospora sp. NPDC088346]|uniref:hypothetical protein n=1 Tax=Kitasatospora sp. NPDC088346 TaxID=3364073 RepID=UPI003828FD09
MNTDTAAPGADRALAGTIEAARLQGLAEQGREQRAQYTRARDLFFPAQRVGRGHVGDVLTLGPHTGDTYIAELIEKSGSGPRTTYAVVIDGKPHPHRAFTLDAALLLHLAVKYSGTRDGATAARYAARTLGMPDPDQQPEQAH